MCSMNLKSKAKEINPIRASTAFVDMWERASQQAEKLSLITLKKHGDLSELTITLDIAQKTLQSWSSLPERDSEVAHYYVFSSIILGEQMTDTFNNDIKNFQGIGFKAV